MAGGPDYDAVKRNMKEYLDNADDALKSLSNRLNEETLDTDNGMISDLKTQHLNNLKSNIEKTNTQAQNTIESMRDVYGKIYDGESWI